MIDADGAELRGELAGYAIEAYPRPLEPREAFKQLRRLGPEAVVHPELPPGD